MGQASRYWKLVRIDATGKRQVEVIDALQAFYKQQFPELTHRVEVPDNRVQQRLLQLRQDSELAVLAESSLRCFISHQIEKVCIQLELQFGKVHGFTRHDLFPFVLDEFDVTSSSLSRRSNPSAYKSLATEILQSFEPERGSLAAWTTQLVKHHQELNAFLLERGVYLVSDWAILNDTTPKQLQRIFSEFHHLTPFEVQQAENLLESYHAVYRQDRLKLRQAGGGRRCLPPTTSQLEQISHLFQGQTNFRLSAKDVMTRLQEVAEKLRQYRIYVRGGGLRTDSLDNPENFALAMNIKSPESQVDSTDESNEFLTFYREVFLQSLDAAVEKALKNRITRLTPQKNIMGQQFLNALHLFHCQQKTMNEIASLVGLQAQYQVTRLLKLKEFRADIRQRMLEFLRPSILKKAADYVSPERLQNLDHQVELALDEQISAIMQEATGEASNAKSRSFKSVFAQRLCSQLKQFVQF